MRRYWQPVAVAHQLTRQWSTSRSRLKNEHGSFHMRSFSSQDAMAWETQGPIRDRSKEHLGVGDKGVVMFRQLLKQQIDLVREGGNPMAIIRDPAKNQPISFSASK